MTIAWVEKYKGGVEWGNTALGIDFNWHPILMTLSLIFLYGNGKSDQIYGETKKTTTLNLKPTVIITNFRSSDLQSYSSKG